jgi:hypothetical protein
VALETYAGARMSAFVVQGKLPGRTRPIFSDFFVPLPPDFDPSGERMTLRSLIQTIVREEIVAFRERQEKRRLTRVLSIAELAEGVERGKVDMGGRTLRQDVDEEAAIGTALQAFEDGIYLVFVADRQAERLDEEVFVGPNTRVTFVRLVALAGV